METYKALGFWCTETPHSLYHINPPELMALSHVELKEYEHSQVATCEQVHQQDEDVDVGNCTTTHL